MDLFESLSDSVQEELMMSIFGNNVTAVPPDILSSMPVPCLRVFPVSIYLSTWMLVIYC